MNRVQNLRKDSGLDVTDRIDLTLDCASEIESAIASNETFICNEVLANTIVFKSLDQATLIDLITEGDVKIQLTKL